MKMEWMWNEREVSVHLCSHTLRYAYITNTYMVIDDALLTICSCLCAEDGI